MIENLSDTVIIPIAGIIFTFVMCYELIQMVIDRNNMHDFLPSDIFKWMMKTFIAVVLVTNTFPIMMGIFDVTQSVISNATGVTITDTAVGVETLDALRESLLEMDIGSLLGLYLQSFLMAKIQAVNGLRVEIFARKYYPSIDSLDRWNGDKGASSIKSYNSLLEVIAA